MTVQFLREAHLIVGPEGSSSGLDFSQFKFVFSVKRADIQTPASCSARIYNVSDSTANQVMAEFKRIVIRAGYVGAAGVIFNGSIIQATRGKESPVDTFLDIIGADSDVPYNYSFSSGTLAAGYTNNDVKKKLTDDFVAQGAVAGTQDDLGAVAYPRGKVIYGDTKDHMQTLADTTGTQWGLHGGAVQITSRTGFVSQTAVKLTGRTGLIGLPRQTQGGIYATCLLNSTIVVGSKVWIDNKSIQRATISPDYTAINQLPAISTDGFYKVYTVNHQGDTRGNEYYTTMTLLANDPNTYVPPSLITQGLGAA